MSDQLIIVLSGRKQAGKNTACNFIVKEYLNKFAGYNGLYIEDSTGYIIDPYDDGYQLLCKQVTDQFLKYGIKVYSYADPLKRFCIDVLGAPEESCYGTDEQKNQPIPHLLWDNLPKEIVPMIKTGPMTGRELMQIFGTEICRRLYSDCWVMGTFSSIRKDNCKIALICDGRFPNEIDISKRFGAKTIRLKRKKFEDEHKSETALDNYDESNYDIVLDNQNLTIPQTCLLLSDKVNQWMSSSK